MSERIDFVCVSICKGAAPSDGYEKNTRNSGYTQ